MSFKDKPLKKINGDNRVTIDVLHNDLIKSFNNENDEMEDLEEQITILKEEYDNWRGNIPPIDDVLVIGFQI